MLIKNIWYLRDQEIVATTKQINHQAADQVVLKVPKNHFPHPVENQPEAQIGPMEKEPPKALVTKNKARKDLILHRVAVADHTLAKAIAKTEAALPVAKRKLLYPAANHTQADQQIATTVLKRVTAAIQARKGKRAANPTQAG